MRDITLSRDFKEGEDHFRHTLGPTILLGKITVSTYSGRQKYVYSHPLE